MNQPRKITTCNILTVSCALAAMRFINDNIRRKTLSLFIVTWGFGGGIGMWRNSSAKWRFHAVFQQGAIN